MKETVMDIYSYLKKDHRHIADLMEELLETRSYNAREEIFDEIREELLLHAETEKETFYAALENKKELKERIEESEEDHDEIKDYLNKLFKMPVDHPKWLELFGELKHAFQHHVKEEEVRIFKKAKEVLSADEAKKLAKDMDALKNKPMEKAA
jgi:hypothetical protein